MPRFPKCRSVERTLARARQPTDESMRLGERSRFEQMVCYFSRAAVRGARIRPLDSLRDGRVQLLPPRARDAGEQRLTHQLVGERERRLRPFCARDDHSHLLRLLDNSEEFVDVSFGNRTQQLEAEAAAYHRRGRQHAPFILLESLQSPPYDEPN